MFLRTRNRVRDIFQLALNLKDWIATASHLITRSIIRYPHRENRSKTEGEKPKPEEVLRALLVNVTWQAHPYMVKYIY